MDSQKSCDIDSRRSCDHQTVVTTCLSPSLTQNYHVDTKIILMSLLLMEIMVKSYQIHVTLTPEGDRIVENCWQ